MRDISVSSTRTFCCNEEKVIQVRFAPGWDDASIYEVRNIRISVFWNVARKRQVGTLHFVLHPYLWWVSSKREIIFSSGGGGGVCRELRKCFSELETFFSFQWPLETGHRLKFDEIRPLLLTCLGLDFRLLTKYWINWVCHWCDHFECSYNRG